MDFSLFSLMSLTVYSQKVLSLLSHFVSYWRVTASEYDLFNEPTGRWVIQGYQRERREYVPISTKMSGIGYPIPQRTDRLLRSFMKFSSFHNTHTHNIFTTSFEGERRDNQLDFTPTFNASCVKDRSSKICSN